MTTKISDLRRLVGYVSNNIYRASQSGFYPMGNYQKQVYRIVDIIEESAGGEESYPLSINTTKTLSGGVELIKVKGKNQLHYIELKQHHIWGSHFNNLEANAEAKRARIYPKKSATGEFIYEMHPSMTEEKPDSTMCVCPHCKAWNGVNEKTCYRCGYIFT